MRTKIFKGTALVVSRNDAFQHALHRALGRGGYGIHPVATQQEGLRELHGTIPTIVIVDRTESGFAQLHHALPDHVPILTVLNHPGSCDESHCIPDIEDGAARAVCNAGPSVIVALADAVLRRQHWQQPALEYFAAEDVTIDFANYEVKVGTTTVSITPTQFRILRSLVVAPGHFLSRQALFDQVWGEGFAICPHTLDVNLSTLRRALHSKGTSPDFIVTLKGVGFKLRSASPLKAVAAMPAASTVSSPPWPTTGSFWNSVRDQEVFRHSAATWRTDRARPISARYRTKHLPSGAKQPLSSHLENHFVGDESVTTIVS